MPNISKTPRHWASNYAAGQQPLYDHSDKRRHQHPRSGSDQESENDIAYGAASHPNQVDPPNGAHLLKEGALVVVVGVLSPQLGFCWWLMLMSLSATYYYTKFVIRSSQPPHVALISCKMVKFATQTVAKLTVFVAMSYWCFSIMPFHIFVPTAMDAWTEYAVHKPLRMTEVLHDPSHDASMDIFAIHGLGSMPDSAWTYKSNETNVRWLSELLPQARGFQDARIIMVNHQTRWDSNAASMELNDHASSLLEHIEAHHKAHPDRPIIFIAHSFGGLLLKKVLLLAKSRSRDVAAMTRGIIFLGVPHRGTYAALIASCLSCTAFFRGSSSNLHEFMSVDGPAILDLESDFYDAYVIPYHPYQPQLYICDVLEMRPERIGKFSLGFIVRPYHGLLRHGRVFTLDTDHRGLNKFHSHDDPNFLMFHRILLQAKTFALQPNPFVDLAVPDPSPQQNETSVTTPDLLEFASYGMPWTTTNRWAALVLGGLEEFVATFLANDRNKYGSYLTNRIPKMAVYESIIGFSAVQALGWLLFKIFEGCTSFEVRILQILISNLTIVPIQRTLTHGAMALIAGARTYHQIRATIHVGAVPMIKLSWALSPIWLLIAHVFLPPQTWSFFFRAISFIVSIYSNTSVKKKRLAALRKRHVMEEMNRTARDLNEHETREEGNGEDGSDEEWTTDEGNDEGDAG